MCRAMGRPRRVDSSQWVHAVRNVDWWERPVHPVILPHRGLWMCRIILPSLAPPTTTICAHICHVQTTLPHLYWKFSRCVPFKLHRHACFTDSTVLPGNNLLCVLSSKVKYEYYRNLFGMQTSNTVFGMT